MRRVGAGWFASARAAGVTDSTLPCGPVFLVPDLPPLDVQRELAAMRAELAEIRTSMRDGWLGEARAEQVRAIVRDALEDSATRASFLADRSTVRIGPGGATVGSADGLMTMTINVCEQVRFVASSAYGPAVASTDSNTRWGMENKLFFLSAAGTIVDPSITYVAAIAYTSQSNRFIEVPNTLRVLYARMVKDFGEGLSLHVGLINVPFDVESEYIGSSMLTSGDWSIFNYRFGIGKQPGVGLDWQGESIRAAGFTFSQLNSLSEGWDDATNLSFAVAGRVNWRIGGSWEQLDRMSGSPEDPVGVVLGVGACMSNGRGQNPQPPPDSVLVTPSAQGVTADIRVLLGGTRVQAQGVWMRDPVGAPELGWYPGANLQVTGFVAERVEPFVEACWMGDVPVEWIAQFGTNIYFDNPSLKLTLKSVVPFGGGDVNGIRAVAGGLGIADSDNNASFIAQLQIKY